MSGSIVVADAGPIHYLVLVECGEALGRLFERVLIPTAVRYELLHPRTPEEVKRFLGRRHPWMEVHEVQDQSPIRGLHKGETEAIQLGLQARVATVLMDDLDGRKAAREAGLVAIGTIGILEMAAEREFVDLSLAISKLRATNFFASARLLDEALKRDRNRRGGLAGS